MKCSISTVTLRAVPPNRTIPISVNQPIIITAENSKVWMRKFSFYCFNQLNSSWTTDRAADYLHPKLKYSNVCITKSGNLMQFLHHSCRKLQSKNDSLCQFVWWAKSLLTRRFRKYHDPYPFGKSLPTGKCILKCSNFVNRLD